MKIKTIEGGKKYAVTTDTGAIVKEFYHRAEAFGFLEHINKYPAVAARVEAQ